MLLTALIVYNGVEKGIERVSKFIMPILLVMVIGIAIFSLTLKNTLDDGTVRTGIDGLKVYLTPDFSGLTSETFLTDYTGCHEPVILFFKCIYGYHDYLWFLCKKRR